MYSFFFLVAANGSHLCRSPFSKATEHRCNVGSRLSSFFWYEKSKHISSAEKNLKVFFPSAALKYCSTTKIGENHFCSEFTCLKVINFLFHGTNSLKNLAQRGDIFSSQSRQKKENEKVRFNMFSL